MVRRPANTGKSIDVFASTTGYPAVLIALGKAHGHPEISPLPGVEFLRRDSRLRGG